MFLDALASLDIKLSVSESVNDVAFFNYSVNAIFTGGLNDNQ